MTTLRKTASGGFKARKRIPRELQQACTIVYGCKVEFKFSAPAGTPYAVATQQFLEWRALTEQRLANLRAQRAGEQTILSHQAAHELAADWYRWYVPRHEANPGPVEHWENVLAEVQATASDIAGRGRPPSQLEDWSRDILTTPEVISTVWAYAEADLYLAIRGVVLGTADRELFAVALYRELAETVRLLIRRARGDYTEDARAKVLPQVKPKDTGLSPWQLFERWVAERKPAQSTVESWRYVFKDMTAHFGGRSAGSITEDQAHEWMHGLVTANRSARTVGNTHVRAAKCIFEWAVAKRHIAANVFTNVKVAGTKRVRSRETQAFLPKEQATILRAALAIRETEKPLDDAKRWVPWVCAYTGARPGEITQLRAEDVIERDGIHALMLTPEAGTIKNNTARVVPLHEHLGAQGFIRFARSRRGPLFYNPPRKVEDADLTKRKKPRSAQTRQRLAAWVREIGVTDKELSPNHAWRHTFKQITARHGISDRMADFICGHAPATVGRGYGAPTLEDMADALKRFPRYLTQPKEGEPQHATQA